MTRASLQDRTVRLFQFLKAVRSLREPPIRHLEQYKDFRLWRADLPLGLGCSLRSEEDEEDAWLVVAQQTVARPPIPPPDLVSWIEGDYEDFDQEPSPQAQRYVNGQQEAFDAEPSRLAQWEEWLAAWRRWAEDARHRHRVQELYRRLFHLRQQLERDEGLELLWGHGVLAWKRPEETLWHPLLVTPMQVDFDPHRGLLVLRPAGPIRWEWHLVDGFSMPNGELLRSLANNPPDVWDERACLDFYTRVARSLSPEGTAQADLHPPAPGPAPAIAHAPVLFLRRRRTGMVRDLQEIIETIQKGTRIPATIAHVVGDAADPFDMFVEAQTWGKVGEELWLPLPANPEQEEIAARIRRHHGVTVEGPPGTGKSHTIANLICHLLAHGKRVLVTSQGERALRVLQEKIPESIRPLCISLLGADTDSLKALEHAVQAMVERTTRVDLPAARAERERLRERLLQVRQEVAALRQRLERAKQGEMATYSLLGKSLRTPEVARWLAENEAALGFIPDPIQPGTPPPLNAQELARLFELSGRLSPEDLQAVGQYRPDPAHLPAGAHLKELAEELQRCEAALAQGPAALRDWQPPAGTELGELQALQAAAEREAAELAELEAPWLLAIRQDAARGGIRRRGWEELVAAVAQGCEQILTLKNQLAAYTWTLPEGLAPAELLHDLAALRDHLARSGVLGPTLSLLFRPRLRRLMEGCRLNGARPKTAEDVALLMDAVRLAQERTALVVRWNRVVAEVGGPTVREDAARLEVEVDEWARMVSLALRWDEERWQPFLAKVTALGLPAPSEASPRAIAALAQWIHLAACRLKAVTHRRVLAELADFLESQRDRTAAHPLWDELLTALKALDWERWEGALAEARRLATLAPLATELAQLRERLAQVAPEWARRIVQHRGAAARCGDPARAAEAWAWRQAETWLRELGADNPVALQRELEHKLAEERQLLLELVEVSTWLGLAERLTPAQRSALVGWQQAIKRIGKGKGKYAQHYREAARQYMDACRSAVPVWIMPLHRVVESFRPDAEPFDVVVIDESSQCDATALVALFRARRAVIVGDDNQISPEAIGTHEEQVHQLAAQYLADLPHKELYGPRQSLYDIAKRCFPGLIRLREHFRCLPEIIQFSNDLMYGGEILPLREPVPDSLWQPVVARRVAGQRDLGRDINEVEARALVEAVVACCQDPRYDGKTMGFISLLGEAQAQFIEQLLFERLGPQEIERRKLLGGDAYYFQGDERDVIFLSLVESSGSHRKATLNKMSDFQRFNVAASRARDQMWLFYSISADELHPDDVRGRLIRYCEQPARMVEESKELAELCESDFERAVLRELLARGYAVRPQVRVGRYRIDLVVEGMGARLAVECDGDSYHGPDRWHEDQRRQATLERLGWRFFRIRASTFYRNPQLALAPLWERLEEVNIRPRSADSADRSFAQGATGDVVLH